MDFSKIIPCFLIAMPELQDPNFARTVVLLSDYTAEGAAGFIINRPTELILGDSIVLPGGVLNPAYKNLNLYGGGPVEQQRLWVVFDEASYPHPQKISLSDGIGLAQDVGILMDSSASLAPSQIRVIHGYSGWGPGQLEREIAASFWITAPASHDLFFNTPDEKIWEKAIEKLGFDFSKLVRPESALLQ